MPLALRVGLGILSIALASPAMAQVNRNRTPIAVGGSDSTGVQRASCVLQLDFDPNRGGRGFDTQTLNAMLTSTALVDPAAEKALGLSPDIWPKVAQVELIPAGNVALKLSVTVTPSPNIKIPDNAAQAFLDELATRAKASVDEASTRQEQAANERKAVIEQDLAAARQRLEAIQAQLGSLRSPSDGIYDQRSLYRTSVAERPNLEMTIAASKARLTVYETESEKLRSAATRPAASAWADLIDARQKVVTGLRDKRDDVELLKAEADLAETKARAAGNPTQDFPFGSSLPAPDRWLNEMVSLKATIAESEARLNLLNERAPKTAATQPASPQDLERLQREEMRARQEVDELTNQLDMIRRERRGGGSTPKLLILDGKAKPSEAK